MGRASRINDGTLNLRDNRTDGDDPGWDRFDFLQGGLCVTYQQGNLNTSPLEPGILIATSCRENINVPW